ncbi:hypothetical protein [Gimesia sp.]|uniref:hypothetical protein n=1 Tax=Gimesia sp. TaxID=2024833 RepID=UPI003A8EE773
MSTSFKDASARQWNVDLTVGKAMKIKSETGLDMIEALSNIGVAYQVIGELEKDLFQFCKVFHVLTGAEGKGVSLEEFADGMDGTVVTDAFEAMDHAFTNFYPPEKREKIARMKEQFQKALEEGQDQIIEELNQRIPEFKQMMSKGIQEQMGQLTSGS